MSESWPVDEALSFPCSLDSTQQDYLVANAHTFPGRITAFCRQKKGSPYYYVSASTVLEGCSEAARRWVQGFLAGSEPEPPRDEAGDLLGDDHPASRAWRAKALAWASTGEWPDDDE